MKLFEGISRLEQAFETLRSQPPCFDWSHMPPATLALTQQRTEGPGSEVGLCTPGRPSADPLLMSLSSKYNQFYKTQVEFMLACGSVGPAPCLISRF